MSSKSKCVAHNKQASGARLSQRIAEEAQLLAEEKWIIEALKKIKVQRNGLQIERLQLESMRAKLLKVPNPEQTNETPGPSDKTGSANKEVLDVPSSGVNISQVNPCTIESVNFNCHKMDNDELCTMEELNLSVTNSIFDNEVYGPICNEEEEEEDEDGEDMENYLLDMDMLMSGK